MREHGAQRRQREVVRGLDECGVVRAQVVERGIDEPRDAPVAGEAHDGIDAAEPFGARIDRRGGLRGVTEIGGERNGGRALRIVEELVDRRLRALARARDDQHARALVHQRRERRAADTPGRTGQNHRVACKQHHRTGTPERRRFPGAGGARKQRAA